MESLRGFVGLPEVPQSRHTSFRAEQAFFINQGLKLSCAEVCVGLATYLLPTRPVQRLDSEMLLAGLLSNSHFNVLHCISLGCFAFNCNAFLHCISVHSIAFHRYLHRISLWCTILHCTAFAFQIVLDPGVRMATLHFTGIHLLFSIVHLHYISLESTCISL